MTYQNPILRGFNPDPSILEVDGTYYMVNSTFQYFPSVIIRKSTDLINWEIIGHAITNPQWLDLSGIPDSHGIWAPDISYDRKHKRFWIFAPLRLSGEGNRRHTVLRRQLVMWADRPEGPYSQPICLEMDSIDPSHFIDDDGQHYLVNAPGITVTPLTEDCSTFAGETVQAWPGTGKSAPEGPHILKKNGWYYAILAEGGTGYNHQISIARSRSIYGPYEPCPHNPVLKQNDPDAVLQRCGHAKFLQLPDGRWVAVYLCARPCEGRYTVPGRETALQSLTWDGDGWPVMDDGVPALTAPTPFEGVVQKLPSTFLEDFDGPSLDMAWSFLRTPTAQWSLSERPGWLRIWTEDGDLFERRAKNVLVLREEEHFYEAATLLSFQPKWEGEQAGLCCYYDTLTYAKCAVTLEGVVLSINEGAGEKVLATLPINHALPVALQVRVRDLERAFYCRQGNGSWQLLGLLPRCTFLADEGLPLSKRHTGTMVGIFATNGGCGSRIPADFDWFEVNWHQNV